MGSILYPDIAALHAEFSAAQHDADALVHGLEPAQGIWRATPDSWSVAQCLDHLAVANRVYLDSMASPARLARANGRSRRGPARPGLFGAMFVRSLEPPPKWWSRLPAPRKIRPAVSPTLADAFASFCAAQSAVVNFLRESADLDLAGTVFPNPLVRGISFSLATGLHVIAAHERRHLRQAWLLRRQLLSTG